VGRQAHVYSSWTISEHSTKVSVNRKDQSKHLPKAHTACSTSACAT